MRLYNRGGRDFESCTVEVLYWKRTGKIITWRCLPDRIPTASGEQAKITSGEWGLTQIIFSERLFAELTAENIKIENELPIMVGVSKYSTTQPSRGS